MSATWVERLAAQRERRARMTWVDDEGTPLSSYLSVALSPADTEEMRARVWPMTLAANLALGALCVRAAQHPNTGNVTRDTLWRSASEHQNRVDDLLLASHGSSAAFAVAASDRRVWSNEYLGEWVASEQGDDEAG